MRTKARPKVDPAVLGTPDAPASHRAYDARRFEAGELLDRLEKGLERADGEANSDPTDWGHAGSMAYVVERLRDILEHLGDADAPQRRRR